MKSGSGDLDFGLQDESKDEDEVEEESERTSQTADVEESEGDKSEPVDPAESKREDSREQAERYPYFVRRSNVTDERDNRLEVHVRDKVTDGEREYINTLENMLGDDVAKTDAREFALMAAFKNPEAVADLMREEGFDAV